MSHKHPEDSIEAARNQSIEEALRVLGDQFESVVVLTSHHDGRDDGTFFGWRTLGSSFAAVGMAHRFLERVAGVDR